ncbi:MAG: DUF5665 domain-containing protein [Candidatus Dojkabacteria bacterium]|jgi:Na+/H+ antiporter NhaC
MEESDVQKLNRNIKKLNRKIDKRISFKRNFFISILNGIGTVIGGTIVLAVLVTIITKILQSLGGFPYLQQLLEKIRP